MIDAHVHLWRIGEHGCTWPPPDLEAIHRDVELPELRALAAANGVDGVVQVQCQDDAADTDWLLSLADDPLVLGIVGWSDLRGALPWHPMLKGLRPMVQDLAAGWYDDPAIDAALATMAEHGLVLDALVRPRHLAALHRLAARHPALSIVIDHAAKPDVGDLPGWEAEMRALADRPNVACKLSGLVTEPGLTPRIGEVTACMAGTAPHRCAHCRAASSIGSNGSMTTSSTPSSVPEDHGVRPVERPAGWRGHARRGDRRT